MDSNDTMYGSDKKFLAEINSMCSTLIGQVLDHCKTLTQDVSKVERVVTWWSLYFPENLISIKWGGGGKSIGILIWKDKGL